MRWLVPPSAASLWILFIFSPLSDFYTFEIDEGMTVIVILIDEVPVLIMLFVVRESEAEFIAFLHEAIFVEGVFPYFGTGRVLDAPYDLVEAFLRILEFFKQFRIDLFEVRCGQVVLYQIDVFHLFFLLVFLSGLIVDAVYIELFYEPYDQICLCVSEVSFFHSEKDFSQIVGVYWQHVFFALNDFSLPCA